MMICEECGGELVESYDPIDGNFHGVDTHVEGIRHYKCKECGGYEIDAEESRKLSHERTAQICAAKGVHTPWRIKAIRKKLGMTQVEFEAVLGVTSPTCSRWENGVSHPDKSTDSIIHMLDVDPIHTLVLLGYRSYNLADAIKTNAAFAHGMEKKHDKRKVSKWEATTSQA